MRQRYAERKIYTIWPEVSSSLNSYNCPISPFLFPKYFRTVADRCTLAWRIPRTGEPGGLPSVGSYGVGHNWSDLAASAANRWWIGKSWNCSQGPQPFLTQRNYDPLCVGPLKTTGHSGEFWQNVVHWRREWQTTSVFLPWESREKYERHKDLTLKDVLLRSVGAQYVIGKGWRSNSKKNEEMEPKQKQHPAVDVTGDESKVQCCKEQYCIGTWNVRSMNQSKLEVVKQEMARLTSTF